MRIIIDTIAELDELTTVWAAGRRAQARETTTELVIEMDASEIRKTIDDTLADLRSEKSRPVTADTRPVTAEGAVIPVEPQDAEQLASAGAGEAPSTDPVPEATPKRKRRTKAEIATDEAAAKAAQEAVDDVQAAAAAELDKMDQVAHGARELAAAATAGVNPEIVALAATLDGADKMAHMNEGRDFIAKHGFPKYNETFALADVPANIAAHTPEQAALHRAAMQWLIAQGGAE